MNNLNKIALFSLFAASQVSAKMTISVGAFGGYQRVVSSKLNKVMPLHNRGQVAGFKADGTGNAGDPPAPANKAASAFTETNEFTTPGQENGKYNTTANAATNPADPIPAIGATTVEATLKATKGKNSFFGAIIGEVNLNSDDAKKIKFGATLGAIFSAANPKAKNFNTNQGIGANAAAATNNGNSEFKQRGLMLLVGPHFSVKLFNKIEAQLGVAATFAGYKLKVNAEGNSVTEVTGTSAALNIPATAVEKRTKLFRTVGAMPFIKAKFHLAGAELFGFVGYNFSQNAKVKNLKTTQDPSLNTAGSYLAQSLYQAGDQKMKTSGLFVGAGASFKIKG